MNDHRKYWRHPSLASKLSEEQRRELAEKFLELVKKNREKYVRQMNKTMKERNRLLRVVTKEKRQE
jgi:hypothetical protein